METSYLYEKLKGYYCITQSEEQSEELTRLCLDADKTLQKSPYSWYEGWTAFALFKECKSIGIEVGVCENFNFPYRDQISVARMRKKIKEAIKTKESLGDIIEVSLSKKEIAFLRSFIGSTSHIQRSEIIDGDYDPFLKDAMSSSRFSSDHLYTKFSYLCDVNGISDNIFAEDGKIFTFKNRKKAKILEDSVRIGCKTYTKKQLLEKFLPVFELVDQITVEGLVFNKDECLEFAKLL